MQKLPISVFIIAQNEADRIQTTINSVKDWVLEVVVVDSGSSDDTVSIATFLGAKVIYNKWQGYGMQKRCGEDECENDWLLNLDADEEISPELAAEITELFANGEPQAAGYIIKVRDLLPNEKKLAPLAHTNYCLRLYNRNHGRFSESPVHDSVILDKDAMPPKTLNSPAYHRSFRNISHAIEKLNSYSTAQAENIAKKRLKFAYIRLILEFPISFLKAYFLRLYMLRGLKGFTYATIYAFSRFVRIAKYLENNKN